MKEKEGVNNLDRVSMTVIQRVKTVALVGLAEKRRQHPLRKRLQRTHSQRLFRRPSLISGLTSLKFVPEKKIMLECKAIHLLLCRY